VCSAGPFCLFLSARGGSSRRIALSTADITFLRRESLASNDTIPSFLTASAGASDEQKPELVFQHAQHAVQCRQHSAYLFVSGTLDEFVETAEACDDSLCAVPASESESPFPNPF